MARDRFHELKLAPRRMLGLTGAPMLFRQRRKQIFRSRLVSFLFERFDLLLIGTAAAERRAG
jgi:hypothetical protein